MSTPRQHRSLRVGLATLIVMATLLAGCVAQPGPAPVVEPIPEPTAASTSTPEEEAEEETRTQISAGVEPLLNGLNPHLISDNNATVESIAALVLPSVFRDGELDTDVVTSAEVVEPAEGAAMTVRYLIDPTAQWSDGTPITGADFLYLWQAMTNTPAVLNGAGYQAISSIRSTEGGRTVDVNFSEPYAEWPLLFQNLVPSHLAEPGAADFATVLYSDIPAAAGRYLVEDVDRARGVITLHRNDRFWGDNPARTDILRLVEVRTADQGTDLVRSGQISYLDAIPDETSVQAYELIPTTQVRMIPGRRQLEVVLSTTSPVLAEHQRRRELLGYLDAEVLTRQAAGRTADVLPAPRPAEVPPAEELLLPAATAERPLRIGADPADTAATAAARTLVDLLAQHEIQAQVVPTDLIDMASSGLPEGDIDVVIAWRHLDPSATAAASTLLCPPVAEPDVLINAPTAAPSEEHPESFRRANLSGYCVPDTDAALRAGLRGELEPAAVHEIVQQTTDFEHLRLPLLIEHRVVVLGEGIVGPSPNLHDWSAGLETAATWRSSK